MLDSGAGDDIVNPDNLGIDAHVLLIQEDRNDISSGYARVPMYDLITGALTPVARLDPPEAVMERGGGPGVWESSGVVDASAFFGRRRGSLNVQAHHTRILQQGIGLEVDSAAGQRGQLILLRIPGS